MDVDLAVKNVRLVSPRGILEAGVAVKDGRVVAVSRDIHLPKADTVIDGGGRYVLPGLLDGHSHIFVPPEDSATGTRSAAKGGITTMLEMPGNQMGCFDLAQFQDKLRIMKKTAHVDFCLHAGCASGYPEGVLAEMWGAGATGAKFFISNAGPTWPQTFDGEVLERFNELSRCGGLALIHAENDSILRDNEKRLKGAGRVDYSTHLECRPRLAEIEAGRRMIDYLKNTGCRGLIVHTSVPDTVWYSAQSRIGGAETYVETCPQYLYLVEDDVRERGPWLKFAPPPRTKSEMAELRRLLNTGLIDTVATDHAPYGRDSKEEGLGDMWMAPNGVPGLETFLPLLLNGVNQGWLSLERLAAATAETPARIYGIYPRKGALQPGSDADMVIVDLKEKRTIRDEDQVTACGWTPYHGLRVEGWPKMSIIRGRVVMEDDQVLSVEGSGSFIPRLS
jgi:dihydroorotase (multifunctional complex type)